jgi:hypothetical protein
MATEIKTISVSREFADLAKDNNCSWSEAARMGMSLLLAERGVKEYDNDLNICRRLTQLRIKLEQTSEELNNLKDRTNQNAA